MRGGRLVFGWPEQQGNFKRFSLRAGNAGADIGQHRGQQVGQPGKRRIRLAGGRLTAQHTAAGIRGSLDSRAPQGGLARACLTRHGQRRWLLSGGSTSNELTHPPPLGSAHKLATRRGHAPIPSHSHAGAGQG